MPNLPGMVALMELCYVSFDPSGECMISDISKGTTTLDMITRSCPPGL